MSSRKLIALDFIKRYFARWGKPPSMSEIAAILGVSRQRANDLVHQLAADQMIEVIAGKPRGIRLIDRTEELSEAEVLARLSAMGWTIGAGNILVEPAAVSPNPIASSFPVLDHPPLTDSGLGELPILDHVPEQDEGTAPRGKEDKEQS